MKTFQKLIFLLSIINSFITLSQDVKKTKLFNLKEFNINTNTILFQQLPDLSPSQMSDMIGIPSFFDANKLTGFQKSEKDKWIENSDYCNTFLVSFQIKESKNYLRLGLNFSSSINLEALYYKDLDNTTINYQSSYLLETYQLSNDSKKIATELSFVHNFNLLKKLESYVGLGLSGGFAVSNSGVIYHTYYSDGYNLVNPNNTIPLEFSNSTMSGAVLKNKNTLNGSIFIPVGLSLKLSQNKQLLNQISVFTEVRPTYSILTFSDLRSQTYFQIQYGLGIRFSVL